MSRIRSLRAALLALLLTGAYTCFSILAYTPDVRAASQAGIEMAGVRHVFYVMMENHRADQIIGNTADAPYINQLANQYVLADHFYGVTHPSLPNYLAAISGDFQGIWDSCSAGADVTCDPEAFVPGNPGEVGQIKLLTDQEIASSSATPHMFNGPTIVDQLESQGKSWKGYMQSMPSPGFTGEAAPTIPTGQTINLYVQKHNPFMYFSNIRNNPARMNRLVPLTQLQQDLANNTVPDFSWITPDQCNDMHGVSPAEADYLNNPKCSYAPLLEGQLDHGSIQLGDAFLQTLVPQIKSSPAWNEGSVIMLVWDEDDFGTYTGCCGSPTGIDNVLLGGGNTSVIMISSRMTGHFVYTPPANHYTLLRGIEDLWGLPCLANACRTRLYFDA